MNTCQSFEPMIKLCGESASTNEDERLCKVRLFFSLLRLSNVCRWQRRILYMAKLCVKAANQFLCNFSSKPFNTKCLSDSCQPAQCRVEFLLMWQQNQCSGSIRGHVRVHQLTWRNVSVLWTCVSTCNCYRALVCCTGQKIADVCYYLIFDKTVKQL